MKRILLIITIIFAVIAVQAQDIGSDHYVAPIGHSYSGMGAASDSNDGSYANPWATWQHAFENTLPGETTTFRGGIYDPFETTFQNACNLIDPTGFYHPGNPRGHSGTEANPIVYKNYPNEVPIFDGHNITSPGDFLGGITTAFINYVTFEGLVIRNIWQRNFSVAVNGFSTHICSNLTFKNMSIHDIGGRGMWLTGVLGYLNPSTIISDTMKVINCDFYNCADTLETQPFNMGDGIKGDFEANCVLVLEGSRAWNCSDDGFDLSGSGKKLLSDTWAFDIGVNFASIYVPDDGNGFKLGGVRDSVDYPNWEMRNCISAGNYRYGIHLLDYTPYYRDNARIYNSVFYNNDTGIASFSNPTKPWQDLEFYNCITFANTDREMAIYDYDYPTQTCNWDFALGSNPWVIPNAVCTVEVADFVSVDINLLSSPRNADYSLPDVNFFKPVLGSDLIGAGTDVGLPFNGVAPDVGVFEYDNDHPIAYFTNAPNVNNNTLISFDGSGSTDNGTIVSYEWAFGDGNTVTGITTSHTYNLPTTDTLYVKLKVTDNDGLTNTYSSKIRVLGVDPIAKYFRVITRPEVGWSIPYNSMESIDDVGITSWYWTFGDGGTSTDEYPIHTYSTPGDFSVSLTVTDANSNVDTYTKTENVRSLAPVASFDYTPNPPSVNQLVTYDASASSDDVGIVRYGWNFGDGTSIYDGNVIETHTYTSVGTFHTQLTVVDADGTIDITSKAVNVQAASGSPSASFTATPNPAETNQTITFDGSASSDDGAIILYEWTFGDGNTDAGITTAHSYSVADTYTAWLKVTDNEANVDSTSRIVTVNAAPIGGITTIAELDVAQETAGGGDTLRLAANSFVGDITIYADGDNENPLVIIAEDGYVPVFSDNVTLTGDYVKFESISFSGNLNISEPTAPSIVYCSFIGTGEKMTITFPSNDWEGNLWTIDYNNYTNMSSSGTIDGYRKSIWRALYKGKFDDNSLF